MEKTTPSCRSWRTPPDDHGLARQNETEKHNPRGDSADDVVPGHDASSLDLELLGRQRPEQLPSLFREILFVSCTVMSLLLSEYFIAGITTLIPTIVRDLDIPVASTTWPSSAFSLVLAALLLPFGRLLDMHGAFPIYMAGLLWFCAWSIAAGFARDEIVLNVCRAMQAVGNAAFLPASLTLLGKMYRPGPRKNLVFSLYGAMATVGFFLGILMAGLVAEFASWPWYFWIGAILTGLTAGLAVFAVPKDVGAAKESGVRMDWLGSAAFVGGFVLLIFALTDSPHASQRWRTPYIIVTFVAGALLLSATVYIEGYVATQPLVPLSIFRIKYMAPFLLALLFSYGTLGIYLLYSSLYIQNIMNVSPLMLVAWFVPFCVGSVLLCVMGGAILHIVSGTMMLVGAGTSIIIASVLFGCIPAQASYWAWIFPAMISSTLAIDLTFNVANVFISNALPERQQGLAGALANCMLYLSIAVLLGLTEIVVAYTSYQGLRQSYKNAFWFELACGVTALVITACFVRVPKAASDLTADEKEAVASSAVAI